MVQSKLYLQKIVFLTPLQSMSQINKSNYLLSKLAPLATGICPLTLTFLGQSLRVLSTLTRYSKSACFGPTCLFAPNTSLPWTLGCVDRSHDIAQTRSMWFFQWCHRRYKIMLAFNLARSDFVPTNEPRLREGQLKCNTRTAEQSIKFPSHGARSNRP